MVEGRAWNAMALKRPSTKYCEPLHTMESAHVHSSSRALARESG